MSSQQQQKTEKSGPTPDSSAQASGAAAPKPEAPKPEAQEAPAPTEEQTRKTQFDNVAARLRKIVLGKMKGPQTSQQFGELADIREALNGLIVETINLAAGGTLHQFLLIQGNDLTKDEIARLLKWRTEYIAFKKK